MNKFATVGYIIPKYKLYIQNFNCMRPCTRCMHRYVHIDSVSRNGVRFHVSKRRFSSISNNFLNTKILKNNLQRSFSGNIWIFAGKNTRKQHRNVTKTYSRLWLFSKQICHMSSGNTVIRIIVNIADCSPCQPLNSVCSQQWNII